MHHHAHRWYIPSQRSFLAQQGQRKCPAVRSHHFSFPSLDKPIRRQEYILEICAILDRPNTIDNALDRLEQNSEGQHHIRRCWVNGLTTQEAIEQEACSPLAELYLLKSDREQGIAVGQFVERRGATVINSSTATELCRDRTQMSRILHEAHLAYPQTFFFPSLNHLLINRQMLATLSFPGIIKSQKSIGGDLVSKVQNKQDIEALATTWGQEPIIYQEFIASDGWDIKLWVVDQAVFAARRRSPLDQNARRKQFLLDEDEIDPAWRTLALSIGQTLDLHIYGV